MGLSLERCCEQVDAEIGRLAEVTSGADPATPVPTCPGWTLADLLQHTGEVFRWAATMVRDSSPERLRREDMDWDLPSSPHDLPRWIADGAGFVVSTFRASQPSTPMWAWGWPKSAAFWPRRMVHEIGVHRADAELALGVVPSFDPEVAADGVGELLDNLPHAEYFAPGVAELRGDGEAIGLRADDAGSRWRIALLPDRFEWERRASDEADGAGTQVEVAAPAGRLLLALYGRTHDVAVTGDAALWDRWRARSSL